MTVVCSCCSKQAVEWRPQRNDKFVTTIEGARADANPRLCICGYCAEDLDENGLFPEERCSVYDGVTP